MILVSYRCIRDFLIFIYFEVDVCSKFYISTLISRQVLQAKFERSRFSSPRITPVNSEEPGKEKMSDNASRETSEVPKAPRVGRASKE